MGNRDDRRDQAAGILTSLSTWPVLARPALGVTERYARLLERTEAGRGVDIELLGDGGEGEAA